MTGPLKRTKAQRQVFRRRAERMLRRTRLGNSFRKRMAARRRYWLARRQMRGHPEMTLQRGMMGALLHELKLA